MNSRDTLKRFVMAGLIVLLAFAAGAYPPPTAGAAKNNEFLVYFGTYTGKKSKGIYVSRFDAATGKLGAVELAAESVNPSFLAVEDRHRFLYAVNEVGDFKGQKAGAVSAYAIDRATGRLGFINQESSVGAGPCHLIVDKAGRNVIVANYGGGSVAVLPVRKDGGLQPHSAFIQRTGEGQRKASRAHGAYLDTANRFAYVPFLGLDEISIYRFNSRKGTLVENIPPAGSVPPGSGPRHLALHPSGRFAYVINETLCTMTAFSCDSRKGVLKEIQTLSTLPAGESVKPGYSTAEVFAHPSGRFLYGSNRGHDTIVGYAIDPKTGRLTVIEHTPTQGKIPRSFGIDPSGRWFLAANQNSDTVVVFRIDPTSGRLTPAGQTLEVGAPVSVVFVPAR